MKKILLLTVLFTIFVSTACYASNIQSEKSENVFIANKTTFVVELSEHVYSKRAIMGEVIEVKVCEDIIVNNVIVIKRGTTGYVRIVRVRQPGNWQVPGSIEIKPEYTKTLNAIKVPLTNDIKVVGLNKEVVQTTGIATGGVGASRLRGFKGIGGAGIGGLLLVFLDPSQGKDAMIPAGTKFMVAVNGNVDLKVSPDDLRKAMENSLSCLGTSSNCGKSWSGTYLTDKGKMILFQHGSKIEGSYEQENGIIDARIVGEKLVGTWEENVSSFLGVSKRKGYIELRLSGGGQVQTLLWKNDGYNEWINDPMACKLSNNVYK